ncbi:relaxase domain-containing protein [Pusillimonas sp. T7-7]|uniref:relaxase domain-containing protein n=1 Tax=Pusillimonas sp. (strain T7-7) TaxID=1007105 RepID=UPI0009FC9BDB|nr:relaxase domain-containing protein [Pusillimonas sp. T7-7]
MISLQTLHRGNAGKAGHYYADQKDDYYSKEGGAAQWQGQGDDIALSTSIRKDSKARAALDLTFSAPKSISIQALVGKDVKVLEAHDHAVTKTLEYLERELVRGRHKEDASASPFLFQRCRSSFLPALTISSKSMCCSRISFSRS